MEKKRWLDLPSSGQITVFVIVGVVVLFAFIFIFLLSAEMQHAGLEDAKESAFSNIFKKEALRIYVEDCLDDTLTNGLKLLGEQGRIWADQGGTVSFSGRGVAYGDTQVAYGIWYKPIDVEHPERYPCMLGTGVEPAFCKYTHGDPATFGTVRLSPEVWSPDLQHYLGREVPKCVENELLEETSPNFNLNSEGADFTVAIKDEGVTVDVHYPLRVAEGDVELFELSTFSFLYPTRLKSFLDVAILEPLQLDWQHVDFPLKNIALKDSCEDPLNEGCQYQRSRARYNGMDVELSELRNVLGEGTDFFEFRPVWNDIKLQDYVFRYARQNRPPVLDYVSHCPNEEAEYDWLIVEDVPELSEFNPVLVYDDPDEDTNLEKSISEVDDVATITITDDHDASDRQEVRIKREQKIVPSISVVNLVAQRNGLPVNILSLEDPVQILLTNDLAALDTSLFTGSYEFAIGDVPITIPPSGSLCLGADQPDTEACLFDAYDIQNIKTTLSDYFPIANTYTFGADGVEISYGGECTYQSDASQDVEVVDCISTPEDAEYPHPYIIVPGNEKMSKFYKIKRNGREDPEREEFDANNLCCVDNTFKSSNPNDLCFDVDEGCFTTDYYKESAKIQCSNNRGNVCNGPADFVLTDPLKCGGPNLLGCKSNANCANVHAWGNNAEEEGWCYGEFGCEEFCQGAVVDANNKVGSQEEGVNPDDSFVCGCDDIDAEDGDFCDDNYDGFFGGECESQKCVGDPDS